MILAALSKARWLGRHLRVFCTLRDVLAFRRLRKNPAACPPMVPLCLRQAGGAALYCRPGTSDPMVLWDTFWHKYHLPPVQLPKNAVILDLGANVGYTTAHLAARYPGARVIAVEMDAANAELATRNTASFSDRCHVLHAAVWPEDGQVLYTGDSEWGFRVCDSHLSDGQQAMSAPAFSVETIIRKYDLQRIDYVKMDIEGAEAILLKSHAEWLRQVYSMNVEVHSPATMQGCADALTRMGFDCRRHPAHVHCVTAIRCHPLPVQ